MSNAVMIENIKLHEFLERKMPARSSVNFKDSYNSVCSLYFEYN